MEKGELLIITSPYFAAGLLYKTEAAPIIKYMTYWNYKKIMDYCRHKGWKCQTLEEARDSEEEYERREADRLGTVDRNLQWEEIQVSKSEPG